MSSPKSVTRILEWTGERYLPWAEDPGTSYEHWHRYAFASQFTSGKRVLDLASGEGYGAALLSRTSSFVVGVDIDRDAVRHARARYVSGNLSFILASAASIPIRENSFDVITCFELIEHIQEQEALLHEAKRLLVSEGLLLISTPNKPEYKQTEPSNPFHTRELELSEFQSLLSRHFREMRLLGQRVYSCSSLWPFPAGDPHSISEFFLDRHGDEFVLSDSSAQVPLYFVALASNAGPLPAINESVLVDTSNCLSKQAARIQTELERTIRSHQEALSWRENQIEQLEIAIASQQQALSWKENQLQQLQGTISSHEAALAWREAQVNERDQAIETLRTDSARALESARSDLQFQKKVADEFSEQLRVLKSSRSWRFIQKFHRIRDRVLPAGSARRRAFERLLGRIR